MATVLDIETAKAGCNGMVDTVDGGTVEIQNSSNQVLVTFTLPNPAFGGAVTDGGSPPKAVATANSISPAAPVLSGQADHFVVKNASAAERWRGACGTANAEMILSTLTIAVGVNVSIVNWVFRQRTQE